MNTEILGVVLQIFLLVAISYPLGKYIAKVYKGEKTWSDFMKPVERLIFMEKKRVVVIGGGASGLMASIAAAQNGAVVTVH